MTTHSGIDHPVPGEAAENQNAAAPGSGDSTRPFAVPGSRRPRRGPLDLIGNVWFGITMLFLVLTYCWIGSAGLAPFKDWLARRELEMTEMEWFSFWPFQGLLALMCLSLILVTLRRIRFNRFNLGVWMVHTGILTLVVGSAIYFGTKAEGDMLVYRHRAKLVLDDQEPVPLTVGLGHRANVEGKGRCYEVEVRDVRRDYTLLTGEHKGKQTFAAQFMITPSVNGKRGEPFIRQVLVGYPEYTEDVIPGRGRAKKVAGKAILDTRLEIELEPAANDVMFLVDRPALLARPRGAREWSELPLHGLPRYHEYLDGPADAVLPAGVKIRGTLDLRPAIGSNAAGLADDLAFRITGFLPYAGTMSRWELGGETFEPCIRFSARRSPGAAEPAVLASGELLLARQPERSEVTLPGAQRVRFRWVETAAALEGLVPVETPYLDIAVKSKGISKRVELAQLRAGELALEGTDYRFTLERFVPDWTLESAAATGRSAAIALIAVTRPGGRFTRSVVYPYTGITQDKLAGGDFTGKLLDEDLSIVLGGVPWIGITVAAGPGGRALIRVGAEGVAERRGFEIGQPVGFDTDGFELTVDEVSATATREIVPVVKPTRERTANAGALTSMIRVAIAAGASGETTAWLRNSSYDHPFPREYWPEIVRLPDGRELELLYSRERRKLPAAIVLEDFDVTTYRGKDEVRNYISTVRFVEDARAGERLRIYSNHPEEHAGWWYFQSTWDPPVPTTGHAGMNYSGFGVGNRNGVFVMLIGAFMIVLGSIYAFYVKPILIRRHRREIEARRNVRAAGTAGRVHVGVTVPAFLAGVALIGALTGCGKKSDTAPLVELSLTREFATGVDLSALRLAAAQEGNRLKTVDSLAREKLKYVNPRLPRRVDPVLLYLDLVFAPHHYQRAAIIVIRSKLLRRDLVRGVLSSVPAESRVDLLADDHLDGILRDGRVSPAFLETPAVRQVIAGLQRKLMRSGREYERKLYPGYVYTRPVVLLGALKVVPPVAGDAEDPWFSLPPTPAAAARSFHVPGLAAADREGILTAWFALGRAWQQQSVAAANAALGDLTTRLASIRPGAYPDSTRQKLEHIYYRSNKLTWSWIIYLASVCFLLVAIVGGLRWARWTGIGFFLLAFLLHAASIGIRAYLAGRVPNSNLFEAVLCASWLGGIFALGIEFWVRRTVLASVPLFAGAVGGMVAMMVGDYFPRVAPESFSGDIAGSVRPLLDTTLWLMIHTNLVIASYALIFFGGVSAAFYVVLRVVHDVVPLAPIKRIWMGKTGDAPVAGGAAAVILSEGGQGGELGNAGLARTLDAVTLVFMELGFILLWLGTVLGAMWADVSWGRPWGWDPKEVFALNTWIIFLILIHVRMKTRDKALWTALLAIVGCAVMLFNWYVVNIVISGLHSYA